MKTDDETKWMMLVKAYLSTEDSIRNVFEAFDPKDRAITFAQHQAICALAKSYKNLLQKREDLYEEMDLGVFEDNIARA